MRSPAQAHGTEIRVCDIAVCEDKLTVAMLDRPIIAVPLALYPRPEAGTPEQRARWELASAGRGVHWPEFEEDLSTKGLLAGVRSPHGSASWQSPLLGTKLT